jgi:hypothetical protein
VWADANADGVTQPGELETLASVDVRAIDLGYTARIERADVFGNESRQRSFVSVGAGAQRRIFDVYFVPGPARP